MCLKPTSSRSTELLRQVARSGCKQQRHLRPYATNTKHLAREALKTRSQANTLPIIPTCPKPTCECAEIPSDLDIDRRTDLNSTMAPYAEHLVVFSGQADWTSKIEDEKETAPWGAFVANVKTALSLKGDFHDPYHNVVVSTSSFAQPQHNSQDNTAQAVLFPSFKMMERIRTSKDAIPDFIKTFLLPDRLHEAHGQLSERERNTRTRTPSNLVSDHWMRNVRPVSSPIILVCSHNTRDARCGIIGPLLHAEFIQYINKRHTLRNKPSDLTEESSEHTFSSHPTFLPNVVNRENPPKQPINVGMISHIGGHKFAGNVIVYIPPGYQCNPIKRKANGAIPIDTRDARSEESDSLSQEDTIDSYAGNLSLLAGKGIWYGRVEPQHVEGIVEQTIGHGTIIKDLFRGGINQDGSPIRLPLY